MQLEFQQPIKNVNVEVPQIPFIDCVVVCFSLQLWTETVSTVQTVQKPENSQAQFWETLLTRDGPDSAKTVWRCDTQK